MGCNARLSATVNCIACWRMRQKMEGTLTGNETNQKYRKHCIANAIGEHGDISTQSNLGSFRRMFQLQYDGVTSPISVLSGPCSMLLNSYSSQNSHCI